VVLVFLLIFLFVILQTQLSIIDNKFINKNSNLFLNTTFIILLIVLSFRSHIGVDFASYLFVLEGAINKKFFSYIQEYKYSDLGYYIINWIGANSIGPEKFIPTNHHYSGIFLVNFFCISVYLCGIFVFIKDYKNKFLALLIFLPYLLFVVSTAYTRQATSLGFILIAFYFFKNQKLFQGTLMCLCSILFHKTAILVIPFFILFFDYYFIKKSVIFIIIFLIAIILNINLVNKFFIEQIIPKLNILQNENISSNGFQIRLFMNLIPSLFFLLYFKQFKFLKQKELNFWKAISISIICIFFIQNLINSTILDRSLLMLSIIQPFVITNIPYLFSNNAVDRFIITGSIIFLYFNIFLVWFLFGIHSYSYSNYKFLDLEIPDLNRPFFSNLSDFYDK